jgi:hypothetical protein
MEHDIHLGCLSEYYVPWVEQSLYSPHRKSSIVYYTDISCLGGVFVKNISRETKNFPSQMAREI